MEVADTQWPRDLARRYAFVIYICSEHCAKLSRALDTNRAARGNRRVGATITIVNWRGARPLLTPRRAIVRGAPRNFFGARRD